MNTPIVGHVEPKNLASLQEIYLSNQFTYAGAITDMNITVTDNVTLVINASSLTGWAATGTIRVSRGSSAGSTSARRQPPTRRPRRPRGPCSATDR